MDSFKANDITHADGETTHYYEGGNPNGIPLIFIHGWPDIAESWKHQLLHFSATGKYRVIAPDMRGYGQSSAPKVREAYSLETLTQELAEFAQKLGIEKAVWIGHDWGCGVLNALAAHYPEIFLGLALLAVPYRTIELGLDQLLSTINRDIYPEDEYPYGQWDYQKYYETHTEDSIKAFEVHTDRITKIKYAIDPQQASKHGQPAAATSRVTKDGGWFGGHPELLPDIPLEHTSLDQSLYTNLVQSHKKNGWFPPTAYYLNHPANTAFSKKEKNAGILDFPVLFIDAKFDAVCSISTSPKLGEAQKETCRDLTIETVEAAHWLALEKPQETNAVLEKWLSGKIAK